MVKALWNSGNRKEALDLLRAVWPALDNDGRNRLEAEIIAGPPEDILNLIPEDERDDSRDRRIFDRLIILERLRQPPLTMALRDEMARLRERHPQWEAQDGEQAHFTSWLEVRSGSRSRYSVDDLDAMDDPTLIDTLRSEEELREGLLEVWRGLTLKKPARTLTILEQLLREEDPGAVDIWRHGLWGLRDTVKSMDTADRLLPLLLHLPDARFANPEIIDATADVLDAASRVASSSTAFWLVFDRALLVAARSPENSEEPQRGEWVSLAINRSLGRLAEAFFDAMFARKLTVGQGIPEDLKERLDALVQPRRRAHRLARVIAASRLSYLFAVDPDWTHQALLPGFDWANEGEALALWEGFAWRARIDEQLWSALKPHFLPVFVEARLDQFGDFRRNLAQMFMLVGVEFNATELPRDEARHAVRAMPNAMRTDAVAWLAGYLEQHAIEQNGSPVDVDTVWTRRVTTWLRRVWPMEPVFRTPESSQQFGLAVLATRDVFSQAIAFIEPFVVKTDGFYLAKRLDGTSHPDQHPQATLQFIELLFARDGFDFGLDTLRRVLARIGRANRALLEDERLRRWDEYLKARGH